MKVHFFALVVSAVFACSLVGCSSNETQGVDEETNVATLQDVPTLDWSKVPSGSEGGNSEGFSDEASSASSDVVSSAVSQALNPIPSGALCIPEYAANSLLVIDSATYETMQRIPVGQNPATVLVADRALYIGSSGGGEVTAVSFGDSPEVIHVTAGKQPLGAIYDPVRGVVYVGDYFDSSILTIDTKLNSLVGTIKMNTSGYHNRTDPPECCRVDPGKGRRTVCLALAPEGDILYAANYGTYDIARIDLVTGEELEAFDGVVGPRQIIVSQDGKYLYLAGVGGENEQQVDSLYVIDRETGKRVEEVFVGQSVSGVAQTPDGSVVLALSRDEGALVALDPSDWQELGRVDVGVGADKLRLSTDGVTAYVTNNAEGELVCIDVPSMTVVKTVDGLASPKDVVQIP